MREENKKFIIHRNVLIKDAISMLDKAGERILFVVDDNESLYGSISDGDIRRWILSEGNMDLTAEKVCFKNPTFAYENYDIEEIKKVILDLRISAIPVLDKDKRIIDILFWNNIFDLHEHKSFKTKLTNSVVIMAGGKGSRLDPFTRILPKPLIPIGEKAVIEIIIDKFFIENDIRNFYLTLNHKAKIIKSYFEELAPEYNVEYVVEDKPLGTAGSMKLLNKKFSEPIFITNCDIIIDCDYASFVEFHKNKGFDLTIAASFKKYKIPYGICEIENGGELTKINEKPEYDYLVNTGMYVINPDTINFIPEDKYFDMTDFIEAIKNNGGKVGVYPISENSWIDTGEWTEYKKAVERLHIS
ncbi:MAG: CBS domain-containing protein [Bacteroidetes bacterium]|nr:CBS domain-containing protein [Bacteroidota bacterium]